MDVNRLQILVSAVNKDPHRLINSMDIASDAIIVNQLIGDEVPAGVVPADQENEVDEFKARILNRQEKGVGLSRNTALEAADHEIIQFGDDDIVYDEGYAETILAEFDAHPEADVLVFNVKAQEGRET